MQPIYTTTIIIIISVVSNSKLMLNIVMVAVLLLVFESAAIIRLISPLGMLLSYGVRKVALQGQKGFNRKA
jgi:hypothetical protein